MHTTTEIEIPIRPLSEIFPHLTFYALRTNSECIQAVTKCPARPGAVWALESEHDGEGSTIEWWGKMTPYNLKHWYRKEDYPEETKAGQDLIEALCNSEMWKELLEKVSITDEYTGKLEFYLEYTPEKAPYKKAAYPNSSTGNVTAIRPQSLAGIWHNTHECYTAGHGEGPNHTHIYSVRIGHDMLHDRCIQITEKEARIIHPNLFEYLGKYFHK